MIRRNRLAVAFVTVQVLIPAVVVTGRLFFDSGFFRFGWLMFSGTA